MLTEREMRERLAPLIQAKVEIINRYYPAILVSPHGELVNVMYPPAMTAEMQRVDDLIDVEWKHAEIDATLDAAVTYAFGTHGEVK